MTTLRLQTGLLSFAILSAAVLANVFYLQPVSRGRPSGNEAVSPADGQAALVRPVDEERGSPVPVADPARRGEIARAVQRELQSRGYVTGRDDGAVRLVLRAAIMAYEFDHGLGLTAEPSEDLLRTIVLGTAALGVAPAGSLKAGPHAEQVIGLIAQSLADLKYGSVKVDGAVGEAMAIVIRRFERDHGLTQTGRISGDLAAKLVALGSIKL
ncbi:MAG: peptidoglycan-binding domain-containing protein [Hyphomicrobiaceae bacterium]